MILSIKYAINFIKYIINYILVTITNYYYITVNKIFFLIIIDTKLFFQLASFFDRQARYKIKLEINLKTKISTTEFLFLYILYSSFTYLFFAKLSIKY